MSDKMLGRESKILSCVLTPQQQHDRADQLAALVIRIEQEKDGFAIERKAFTDKLKSLELERGQLAQIVISGEEERPVEVFEYADFRTMTAYKVRNDTGETIESGRPLTDKERQRTFEEVDA